METARTGLAVPFKEGVVGLLVMLLGVLGAISCLESVTRRRSEGTRKRIDEPREEALVESTEEVSSLSFSEESPSSLISFKKGSVAERPLRRSGILIVSMDVVVYGGAKVGERGRGGREGAGRSRSGRPGVGVGVSSVEDAAAATASFAVEDVLVCLLSSGTAALLTSSSSASSSLSTSTSSASRYHFLRLVQRPQPSWPRRPFCHCNLRSH